MSMADKWSVVEKGTLLKVLDHGYVRLIDYMGSDSTIVESARMSTGRGFEGWKVETCTKCGFKRVDGEEKTAPCSLGSDSKEHDYQVTGGDMALLSFLWRNKHTSPFEMCEMTLEVQAPIFVFREWHRHRTQSYNEFSARYAQMENLHFLPDPSRIQQQGKANKQGSGASMDEMFSRELIEDLKDEQEHVYGNYEEAIKAGVAKEIARINTPVSRYSKMRAKTDLLNWLRFVNLRLRPNAQAEIRQYAEAVATFLKWRFPKTMELFEEHDLYGVQFSRKEMDAIRRWSLRGENLDQAAAAAGLSGSELKEFQKKIEKGGKEIL